MVLHLNVLRGVAVLFCFLNIANVFFSTWTKYMNPGNWDLLSGLCSDRLKIKIINKNEYCKKRLDVL